MIVDVITIFPSMFDAPMSTSMVGLARERGLLELRVHDLRDYTEDRHRTTDDYPYGGGPGMVMRPEPLFRAVRSVQALGPGPATVAILTPGGKPLTQSVVGELSKIERLILVCGRYEGVDERVFALADMRLSIGDYVLTGGELPAMVVIDAVVRLVPGVLGHEDSASDESFSEGLLEYPQYTRPACFEDDCVPEVLLSGDHARIAAYRRREAVVRTALLRPDLLPSADLTDDERAIADSVLEGSPRRD
ncbi:MAG: tRNA (guanosine(37)-N1)-methyltransferase TrmD [Coriobacteriia bacterium]|jgi:tRNA (guanine37-N1)-methyltransferase|nr:tRNA (guanosine(37)-N1)-methyltransferase TrmD [Coriobacteriia bacterium]